MHNVKSDTCLYIRNLETLNHIVKIQESILESYKRQLNTIRETNDFDVDEFVDSILHTNEDTTQFRNAVMFMKHKLDILLENLL